MTHRCTCGYETESMDRFVDHVSDEHDALSIAVETLREHTPEAT
jgi:hypothetical protein